MKKGILVLTIAVVILIAAVGCGGNGDSGKGGSGDASSAVETSVLEGKIDEIKDFMFVIEADSGAYYPFTLGDEMPFDIADFKVGDNVKLEYIGELSEVDAFTGEIVSMEKK